MTTPNRYGGLLTVDLDAIAANYRLLDEASGAARACAVVKADAYGLGAAKVAPALFEAGSRTFFVALLDEAVELRAILPEAEIHVLDGLFPGTEADFVEHGLVPVLNTLDEVKAWRRHCTRVGRRLPADIHVDTGMCRLGMPDREIEALADEPELLAAMEVRYVASHLACAEEKDDPLNKRQLARFRRYRKALGGADGSLCNSSGIFLGSDYHFQSVRPGCSLYGVNPTPDAPNPMAQVVRLQGRILQLRDVDSPMTVGYGATHRVTRSGKIATVAVGYADGYLRSLSNRGSAYVGDVRAPVVGRVSMDLITVDVSDVPERLVRPGHFIDLIGPHNPVDRIAEEAGTIGYEILTSLGRRYQRVYARDGLQER
jgi:alanine racemase